MTTLSPHERATLTDADRAMLDEAVQQIPSEHNALFTALLLSTRAVVRHDTAGVRTAAEGYAELLDAADERARDLVGAAHELREAAQSYEARFEAIERRLDRKAEHNRRTDLQLSLLNVFVGLILIRSLYVMWVSWEGLTTNALMFGLLALLWCAVVWRWWQRRPRQGAPYA